MRICFVVNEIFHWNRYGGFGALTRTIAKNLVKMGLEVYVVTWKGKGQRTIEQLDGFTVLGYTHTGKIFDAGKLAKLCEADVYHVVEPYISSYFAVRKIPRRSKLLVVFQDPWDWEDFRKVASVDHQYRGLNKYLLWYVRRHIAKKIVSKADALFCQAKYIIPKVVKMYQLVSPPSFLPNPVEIPKRHIKSDQPTVCFLARWDPVKRVRLFLNLAKEFPDVNFIAMGKAHDEEKDRSLRKKYLNISNLVLTGFVSEEEKSRILERSWILINTSVHECLPISFLEACAHKTAILSSENPDNFAKDFGFHAQNDNFAAGLKFLINEDLWKERGERGFKYVKDVHELSKVIDKHIKIYENLLE